MKTIKIKTKETFDKGIKTLDKAVLWTERVKDSAISLNKKTKLDDSSLTDYGEEKINYISNRLKDESIYTSKKVISNGKEKLISKIKDKKSNNSKLPKTINKSEKVIKNTNKSIKTSKKNAERAKQLAIKSKQTAQKVTKATIKGTKIAIKAIINTTKGMISAIKSLVGLLAAGGSVALIVVIIICLIGLILCSFLGIFFANEGESMTMTEAVRNINIEVNRKINNEILLSKSQEYEINYADNNWKQVIAIYSVKYSNSNETEEPVLYLNEENLNKLKNIYYAMNKITFTSTMKQVDETIKDQLGKETIRKVNRQVLIINFETTSIEEIMKIYKFSDKQKEQVYDLLDSKNDDLWRNLIYGSSNGNIALVNIALAEEGYVHGDKFWKWYGFDERIEWCAVFVSWVANEANVLNTAIPKFAGVANGIDWFKSRGEWERKGYIPRPGDIIFFDWEVDGKPNHVGIVVEVKDNKIYTIEGNSTNDGVRAKTYDINSKVIFGFGIPNYG